MTWEEIKRQAQRYNILFEQVGNRVTMEHPPTRSFSDFYTDHHEESARTQAATWLTNMCATIDAMRNAQQSRK